MRDMARLSAHDGATASMVRSSRLERMMGGVDGLMVRYADKEVTYHSLTELMAARDLIRSELQASGVLAASSSSRGVASLAQYSSD